LASAEGLRVQLQKALQHGQEKLVEELPDGIHSVRACRCEKGIFFCFEAHPDDEEKRQPFWLYWDHNTRRFEDNMYRIAELIACDPDEERATTTEEVYDVLPKAIEYVVELSRRTRATEDARTKVSKEQTAVRLAIREEALQSGVERERVLTVLQFLNEPMFPFSVRKLRNAHKAYQIDDDIKKLFNAVDDLRMQFQKAEDDTQEEGQKSITAEDLHLVCFEHIA